MTTVKKVIGKNFRLLDFQVYDHKDEDGSDADSTNSQTPNPQFTIQMFGINESGDTVSIKINDYEPFFYVKADLSWDQYTADQLLTDLTYCMPPVAIFMLKCVFLLIAYSCY